LLTLSVSELSKSAMRLWIGGDLAHISIDVDLVALTIEDVVLAVLLGDALGSLLECLDRRVGPPFTKSACIISFWMSQVQGSLP
jgi:hypothetical protein